MKKIFLILLCALLIHSKLLGATHTVTSNADSGPGSLREAVANATTDGDIITFSGSLTITLVSAISSNVGITITGNGTSNTIIDGGGLTQIFLLTGSASTPVTMTDMTLQHGHSTTTGGAIGTTMPLILTNVKILNNIATSHGGGIHASAGLTLNATTISNNSTSGNGGGIFISSGKSIMQGVSITHNIARGNGGGSYLTSAGTLHDVTVSDNKAGYDITTSTYVAAANRGGGVFTGDTLNLKGNVIFERDTVGGNFTASGLYAFGGGAIYSSNAARPIQTVELTSLLINQNAAIYPVGFTPTAPNVAGGGIYSTGPLILEGSSAAPNSITITNNTTGGSGGGIFAGASLVLQNTTFTDNKAGYIPFTNKFTTGQNRGGGVHCSSSSLGTPLTLKGSIVLERNKIGGGSFPNVGGGGIYLNTPITTDATGLDSLLVNQNESVGPTDDPSSTSANGGGIFSLAPLILTHGKITISNNSSANFGGGIYVNNVLNLSSASLINNMANVSGAGVYKGATGTLTIDKSIFANNVAQQNGGGIFTLVATTATVNAITNSTFSENEAVTGNGGAIDVSATTSVKVADIALSTFNGNTAVSGNAIFYASPANQVLHGNIIYGNGSGNGINTVASLSAAYNVVEGQTLPGTGNLNLAAGNGAEVFATVTGDLATLENNGGPTQTLNIKERGYAHNFIPLSVASGWGAFAASDQRNLIRPVGCGVDAGSVELQVVDDVASYSLKSAFFCEPGLQLNADTLIVLPVNMKTALGSYTYFQNSDYSTPLAMPMTVNAPQTIYVRGMSTSNCPIEHDTQVAMYPKTTTWQGLDADWNNTANWDLGVPGPCTYVVVTQGKTAYPQLSVSTQAVCDTIEFAFGGEVARTDLLTYNGAKLDLVLKANRWNMIAPPLQGMFPGDYYKTSPNPVTDNLFVYTQLYAQKNPQTQNENYPSGDWSGTFSTPDVTMPSGFGLAVWMDDHTPAQNNILMALPKHDQEYHYYNSSGAIVSTVPLIRLNENRFVYEPVLSGGEVALTSSAAGGETAIVGNPFMSHWNFANFVAHNGGKILHEYKLLLGSDQGAFTTYTPANPFGLDSLIAPMQSIIITASAGGYASLSTPVSSSQTHPGATLRSDETGFDYAAILLISASRGSQQNQAAVIFNPNVYDNRFHLGEDSYKLFAEGVTEPVVVYTLSTDERALDINLFGDLSQAIPIGIRTSDIGNIQLQFSGLENFLIGYSVSLHDNVTDQFIDLKTTQEYSFEKTNANLYLNDRFQLVFKKKVVTGFDAVSDASSISVGSVAGMLQVICSDGSMLQKIEVFDLQGRALLTDQDVNQQFYTHALNGGQVYIVKATTAKSSVVKKIYLK